MKFGKGIRHAHVLLSLTNLHKQQLVHFVNKCVQCVAAREICVADRKAGHRQSLSAVG